MANQKNYDSDFCGSLPLHHVNMIQPHGYLLVLIRDGFSIIQASENVADLLGKPVADVMNTPFSQYISENEISRLQSRFVAEDKVPLMLTVNNQRVLVLVHTKEKYIILELEKAEENLERSFVDVFQEVKYSMAAIDAASSVQDACNTAIHELKSLSGFDGVMMYRFDDNWNGTVIAEEKEEGLEHYLGLTFPASDVPKQARQLYLKNPYRLIPNRNYAPVRLFPVLNPLTNSFTDLSDCNLRSVAAVHLEYLESMYVVASMSIRVICNDRLWGLIACHHKTPHYLNFEICSMFELLSGVISNKITSIINKEEYDFVNTLQSQRVMLTAQVYAENNITKGLLHDEGTNILNLFKATGAVIFLNGKSATYGDVPSEEYLENLSLWLQGKVIDKVYATNHLADAYDEAFNYTEQASGMLVIPIDSLAGEYIVCFRPEGIHTINWGGNPNQAINFEDDGRNYHPRNSFKLWQETVKHTSLPWHEQELNVAETLRSFIFEFKTRQLA
ncbi:GAF domain-containing protein [Mucilaginibacter lacusdianchii]|uniref:GAF domain-containing protein n=1 Tax=Mucilaginibacter lacusdianchii TaxID=2684211 RepID=UPI00131A68AE|nr:GAF domain-containing protein [Mucilaginibacter sp. JXJ CY 39]